MGVEKVWNRGMSEQVGWHSHYDPNVSGITRLANFVWRMNVEQDRLERLANICESFKFEVQSPHDSSVEDALFLILDELRELKARHCYGPEVKSVAGLTGKDSDRG